MIMLLNQNQHNISLLWDNFIPITIHSGMLHKEQQINFIVDLLQNIDILKCQV